MSDFFLPEVAELARKDARTLRRWCIAGVVPGAWKSPGGHWRIKAESLENAAGLAMRGARDFSRKRNPQKKTIGGKPVPAEMLARVEAMKRNLRKNIPSSIAVIRVLQTMPEEFAPDGVLESPFLANSVVSAIAWVMAATGELRPHVEDVAPAFGMGRRKFYRKFGKHLPDARISASRLVGVNNYQSAAFVQREGRGEDMQVDIVPVCFHEYASDNELRAWAGACRAGG
jgi:hypothetical protein